jgi:hypothetical protein
MQKTRYNLLMPEEIRKRVRAYQERMCLPYESQAVIQLLRIALESEERRMEQK